MTETKTKHKMQTQYPSREKDFSRVDSDAPSDGMKPEFAAATGCDEYTVTGPNAHGSTGDEGKFQTEVFVVPNNLQILYLEQECVGGPCGWSYNPQGGYSIWYRLYEGGTKAEWRRKHTSHPVTYRIRVYWQTK